MSITSADPGDLKQYTTIAAGGRRPLEQAQISVASYARAVSAACADFHPHSGAIRGLEQLLANMELNERFVDTVHDALVDADHRDAGPVTVSDQSIALLLRQAGLDAPPSPVTVEPLALVGLPPMSGFVDDPICAANGNLFHGDEDLPFPGLAQPLSVVRSYNSLAHGRRGVFGWGWTSIVDVRLDPGDDGVVRVQLADGAVVPFTASDAGAYRPAVRPHLRLEHTDDGWALHDGPGTRWNFDAEGTLRGGRVGAAELTIARRADRVEVREGRTGRWVRYDLGAAGRVRGVEASDGRRCTYRYDGDGHLMSAVRPSDTIAYEVAGGLLVAVVDADDVTLFRNDYDATGRVVRQISPHGRISAYEYSPNGTTLVTDDAGGPRNLYAHDRRGNLTAVVDGAGMAMRMTYDATDRVRSVRDRTGATWSYEHDDGGRVVARIDPDGLAHRWRWDDAGRVTAETDRAGHTTRYEYDGDRQTPSLIVGPDGASVHTVTDDRDLPVEVTDADGVVTRFTWDADGNLTAITDALGHRTTFEHDRAGRLVAAVDATGTRTTFALDPSGRVRTIDTPDGREAYAYTAAGRPRTGTTPGDVRWEAGYDSGGQLRTFADGAGATVTFERDRLGNLVTVVAPDGAVYRHEHDTQGRLVAAVDPAGRRSTKTYDAEGRDTSVTGPDGHTWRREVDVLGRSVAIVGPDGARSERHHHPNGEVAAMVDPHGGRVEIQVDAYGRVTAATDPTGARTTYEYTAAGRLLRERSPMGRVVEHNYDAAGRRVATTLADGARIEHELHANGAPQAVSSPSGDRIDYDAAGRPRRLKHAAGVREIHWQEGRVTAVGAPGTNAALLAWDPRGLLARATDSAGVVTELGYDVRGRVLDAATGDHRSSVTYDETGWVRELVDALGRATTITNDDAGRPAQVTFADGRGYRRAFDAVGRPLAVTTLDGRVLIRVDHDLAGWVVAAASSDRRWTFTRDALGRLTAVDGGGRRTMYERDADGLVTARRDGDGAATAYERAADGRVTGFIDSAAGSVAVPDTDRAGERDEAGRIVVDRDGRIYRYDDAGRLAESVTVDGQRRRYEYGPLGLLARETAGSAERRYTYDAAGQLTSVETDDGNVRRYAYDAAGRRVGETAPDGGATTYEWDDLGRLVRIVRRAADGTIDVVDVRHDPLGRPVEVAGVAVDWDDAFTRKAVRVGDTRFLRHGTYVRAATTDGDWSAGVGDDPWGDDGGRGMRLGFRGELAIDGLVFMGARVYEPATRTFLSPDPAAPVFGALAVAGPYAYAGNDPVNLLDPSGLQPLTDAQYEEIRRRQEQGSFEKAWEAMANDPWGTLAMTGVLAVGVALCFVPGGQVIGAGILIGAAVPATLGLATGTFNPRSVALGGAIGAIPGGTTLGRAVLVGAGTGFAGGVVDEAVVQGKGLDDVSWGMVAAGTVLNATGGIAAHRIFRATRRTVPGPTGLVGSAPNTARLAQDIAVSPTAPRALPLNRPVGASGTQNQFVQSRIASLQGEGATAFRVNQQQVNVNGVRVGINRPDLQYSLNGQRFYEEFDTLLSSRGPGHAVRLEANDPFGIINLFTVN